MQIAERVIAGSAFVAIILDLSLIPLTSVLVVLLFSALTSVYMCLSLFLVNGIQAGEVVNTHLWKGLGAARAALSILAGVGFAVTLVGVLFRYFTWPSSGAFLQTGVGLMLATGFAALLAVRKEGSVWFKHYFVRASAIGLVAFMMLLSPELFWFEIRHRDKPSYIEAFRNAHENPDNVAYQAELEREERRLRKE